MSSQTWMLPTIFVIVINLLAVVTSQSECISDWNYTSNSTYRANLDTLLSTLSSNVDINGFYNASVGEYPDRVYASVLCRGDAQLDECRSCVKIVAIELPKACPVQRRAFMWYQLCSLRYSNESMFGILADRPSYFWNNPQNSTNPNQFNEDLRILLFDLRGRAASGGSLRKVAAGNKTTSDFLTIMALLQCTPDLSPYDCVTCLVGAAIDIPKVCDRNLGCTLLMPTCYLRFEVYHFYNETRLQELEVKIPKPPVSLLSPPDSPPPQHPPPLPPPGNKSSNIHIHVPWAGASQLCCCCCGGLCDVLLRGQLCCCCVGYGCALRCAAGGSRSLVVAVRELLRQREKRWMNGRTRFQF